MQQRLTPGPLFDDRGRLDRPGWSTSEIRTYDRAQIAASRLRIKEWDYYCVLSDVLSDDPLSDGTTAGRPAGPYGIALTVADNGYMGLLGVSRLDLAARCEVTADTMIPLPLGRMRMPASADSGDVVVRHGGLRIEYRHVPGGRRLTVDHPGFDGGRGLSGELLLTAPESDRMVIATPFPHAPKAFYYNQKINCLPASGDITVGDRTYRFEPSSAFGVFDWGRGVWTYDNTWYWASASGLHNGVPFGFNIGYGFGDTSAASENMLFHNGVAHKLDRVHFHRPRDTYVDAPWQFTSNDGRFEMTFAPILDRAADVDALVLRSTQHQVFGRFTGFVLLDDGTRLDIENLLGFAEEVRNRW
ncbi:DUF2804 domain-containing protein [Rhodococcus chondri]|uniref:DUF2804 domain-containing protein n=1 Tax=Rhodococcus chondri TaxID=3065941 RepID=A0ABU7JQL3_9NOCA|nr:DUF2804 domain-containing protein [Rhodococcus sp. CC-R104]MEE2032047.1 DUF2804 domain-containing protein [Rhodococcus sp. CC-R104]